MNLSPVVIFAFNRCNSLKNTINSLLQNQEAHLTELFIFVDGARPTKEGEEQKVKEVQNYVKSIVGFLKVHYFFSSENKGLGASIINGVTKIINQYGKIIVLEDDLKLSPNFLSFMNQGLDLYKKETEVFSICGYSNKIKTPQDYEYDAYFCTRSSSWGWGTWVDRWNSVDWELKDWEKLTKRGKAFNKWGGSDCFKMLKDWKNGKNQSWAIRFCFNQFLQNKVSLFPILSKVQNDGFDGMGTNCKKWSRFKCDFDNKEKTDFKFPPKIFLNKSLYRSAMKYNSISIRIFSKVMYLLHT